MSDLRIITPKKGYFTFCLREEYVVICDGNHCAAMVLSQHEYWHKNRIDNRQQARSHNEGAAKAGRPATQDTGLWVYKSHEQMKSELLGLFGERAVGQAYKFLLDKGFLDARYNPHQPWDRKPQYLFKTEDVQAAVDALPARRVEEPGDTAESIPQNCGEVSAEVRHPPRNGAASSPHGGGDSKELFENPKKRINQRVAPAAPGLSASHFSEQREPGHAPWLLAFYALKDTERRVWQDRAVAQAAAHGIKPTDVPKITALARALFREDWEKGGGA